MRKFAYVFAGAALAGLVAAPTWASTLSSSKAAITQGNTGRVGATT